jgi:hypothetical protein
MSGSFLSEQYVQDAFHRYLKSSLTQAKLERLLDPELLSSAEADLMITGKVILDTIILRLNKDHRSCIVFILCCIAMYNKPPVCTSPEEHQEL